MFKEFPAVFQDIFRNISQLKYNFSFSTHVFQKERIQQPEFDGFNIGLFKIYLVETSHDTTPPRFRFFQLTSGDIKTSTYIRAHGWIKIVWATFIRYIC